jgi:hypothetical protein
MTMLTFTPSVVLALGIAVIVCAVFGILVERARRAGAREIARLTGRVKGFGMSEIEKNPAAMVECLRADANMCDNYGAKDMAERLRGYASRLERWIDDTNRGETLRRITKGG